VFAAIAPHGGIAIEEACAPDERRVAAVTRAGMEELGRRFERAKPEVAIVLTPHNVHVEGAMAVVTSGTVSGALEGHPDVALRLPTGVPAALARDVDPRLLVLVSPFTSLAAAAAEAKPTARPARPATRQR